MQEIIIYNAKTNNLKSLNLQIPLKSITLITGVSGAGKSSLAIDTIFAESHRRYLQSIGKSFEFPLDVSPDVDYIENLPVSVALKQTIPTTILNLTVGKFTGIEDQLIALFVNKGIIHCPKCQEPIKTFNLQEMAEEVHRTWKKGKRFYVLAPLGIVPHSRIKLILNRIAKDGFVRVLIDGAIKEIENIGSISWKGGHTVSIAVDRLITGEEHYLSRLLDSLKNAINLSKTGEVQVFSEEGEILTFSEKLQCPICKKIYPSITKEIFNKNHPSGICKSCLGKGCEDCEGTGRTPIVRHITFEGVSFIEALVKPLKEIAPWFEGVPNLNITRWFKILLDLNLGYLTPSTFLKNLSAGEIQKLRLAQIFKENLSGVLYILDEPFTFLDYREQAMFHNILKTLLSRDNTIIIIDHHPKAFELSDYIIELGPSAGEKGGKICFAGSREDYEKRIKPRFQPLKTTKREFSKGIHLKGVTKNNLKAISVFFPFNALTSVRGPVGSGKSSLVFGTLYPALKGKAPKGSGYESIEVEQRIEEVVAIKENLLFNGINRSTVSTFINIFTPLREFFATLKESKVKGLSPKDFSYNASQGACPKCRGKGFIEREVCSHCGGKRYKEEVLSIKYKGYSISDVLELSLEQALTLFHFLPSVKRTLANAISMGLGHLKIGQSLSTLSEGERARLWLIQKLSLVKPGSPPSLFLFDHPTSGLHPQDRVYLFGFLERLLKDGHTVIVCENDEDILKLSDWVIELGPAGGPEGGYLIYCGEAKNW